MKVKYRIIKRNDETVLEIIDIAHDELRRHLIGTRIVIPPGEDPDLILQRKIRRTWRELHPKEEVIEEKEEDFDITLE